MSFNFRHRHWLLTCHHDSNLADTEKTDSDGVSGHEFYVILDQVYQYQPDINLDDFVKQHNFSAFKKKCIIYL